MVRLFADLASNERHHRLRSPSRAYNSRDVEFGAPVFLRYRLLRKPGLLDRGLYISRMHDLINLLKGGDIMYREYVVCSNPSCKFSVEGNEYTLKGCPLCGNVLIYKCPACGESIQHRHALFCRECRKPLKPQSEPMEKKKRSRT